MAANCGTEVAPVLKDWADSRLAPVTPALLPAALSPGAHSGLATLALQTELQGAVSFAGEGACE